jgi:predicted enzyme related to lactoylglutathione lyase
MTKLEIDYVEFASPDIQASARFFADAFGWTYNDYGPDYQELANAGMNGGITASDGGEPPLVILKANDLEAALDAVLAAGGDITAPIFSFPGGRRFHFREPGGNVLAVWSEA